MLNAITVDLEDYFQVTAFEGRVRRHQWDQYPTRVVAATRHLLQLFDEHGVQATFFVLGWIASRFPALVREIAEAGHELGCHGYWHRLIYLQEPDEFRADLRKARSAIEDASGVPVTAYRAPSFSIIRQTLWALEILREEGFESDSSIFPIHHNRYGIPDAPRAPHRLMTRSGALWEFPPSVFRFCGLNLPALGGGYFRLYPVTWSAFCLKHLNVRGQPAMFYIHPWELDPDQPHLGGSLVLSARHYLNLDSTKRKLDWLLAQFRFGRMSEVLAGFDARAGGNGVAKAIQ